MVAVWQAQLAREGDGPHARRRASRGQHHAVCRMPHVACYMPVVTWHVACRLSRGTLHAGCHVARCIQRATRHGCAAHAAGPQRVRAVGRDGVDRSGKCGRTSVRPVNGPERSRQYPAVPVSTRRCDPSSTVSIPSRACSAPDAYACGRCPCVQAACRGRADIVREHLDYLAQYANDAT